MQSEEIDISHKKTINLAFTQRLTFIEQPKNLETITGKLKKQEKETN